MFEKEAVTDDTCGLKLLLHIDVSLNQVIKYKIMTLNH